MIKNTCLEGWGLRSTESVVWALTRNGDGAGVRECVRTPRLFPWPEGV